jgi:hypothetical protein
MGWLKNLTGKKDGEAAEGGDAAAKPKPEREFERVKASGETVRILGDGTRGTKYDVLDMSLGGFAATGYDGNLKGNQYLEFQFFGVQDGKDVECEGFANVVRVKDGMLAVKFTPQPRLKRFMREYLDSK